MASFDADIKPLFRDEDREAMLYIMDLWERDDVAREAENILERLEDESMPCDGPWPQDRLDLFASWVEEGCPG